MKIEFVLLIGKPELKIIEYIQQKKFGAIVCDFSPLRIAKRWIDMLTSEFGSEIPVYEVDAHNIVPLWVASQSIENSVESFRSKINVHLTKYLTEFPNVTAHKIFKKINNDSSIDWIQCFESLEVDKTIKPVDWAEPGTKSGFSRLEHFMANGLSSFHLDRNDSNKPNGSSRLSPWFHFGQISVQRCILEISKMKQKYPNAVESFMDHAIVRRELADNFCYYENDYDSIKSMQPWVRETLNEHAKDLRAFVYSREQLENGKTDAKLWNAAQLQLKNEGYLSNALRMYWAKRILEWSPNPEEALKTTIYLNDKYQLDGRDVSSLKKTIKKIVQFLF